MRYRHDVNEEADDISYHEICHVNPVYHLLVYTLSMYVLLPKLLKRNTLDRSQDEVGDEIDDEYCLDSNHGVSEDCFWA